MVYVCVCLQTDVKNTVEKPLKKLEAKLLSGKFFFFFFFCIKIVVTKICLITEKLVFMFTRCLIFCIHELCAVYNLWMSSFSLTKTFCAWLQRFTALSREQAELSNSYAWLFFLVTSEMWNSWSKMNEKWMVLFQ